MEFSNQIKEQRKKLGFTQEEIAKQLYVTRQTVSNWEQGKSYPDLNMLVKISDLYKMSIDSMLKEDTHLQTYLEQGKAYNAFCVLRGLITILYGLFFLLTDEVKFDSSIAQFCIWSFTIIFLIAILYGEHIRPFFLGVNRKMGWKYNNHRPNQKRSWLGQLCTVLLAILVVAMLITRHNGNYFLTLGLTIIGFTDIFNKYMWKQK
ncbi:helix-turn-helix transcriptional regulator [Limosilactobacillus caccae]|uniref:helix-turn-helix transcriptional regulator n=1 Tax=Limosilactobacillus caccae TaxID=1926284 RepID=UPI000970587F|nr:helix-turn-helix transcriptional regulator [Limosilactobacillus caccae]